MKLTDARKLFIDLRKLNQIHVENHAFKDHLNRGFTQIEIVSLIKKTGRLVENNKAATALSDSFLWIVKDLLERECELVVKFEERDAGGGKKEYIIVCSAFRRI